ncbi:MAG: SymE family type I addiction module toxin [Bacteroides sp.]|nr:SymE family type I addiction module toxin [Bacteroides sp.]
MPNISKKKNSAKGAKVSGKKPLKAKVLKIKNSDESLHLRRLTVSSQSVINKKSSNGLKPIPFLRLMGVWLDQAGFPINSQVDVIVDNNLLIIKPADS